MMKRVFVVLSIGFAACATVEVNGVKLDEGQWKKDSAEIRQRASFEMQCEAERIELRVLNSGGHPTIAKTVGVTGCDKQGVYKLVFGTGWVLNSSANGSDKNTAARSNTM